MAALLITTLYHPPIPATAKLATTQIPTDCAAGDEIVVHLDYGILLVTEKSEMFIHPGWICKIFTLSERSHPGRLHTM